MNILDLIADYARIRVENAKKSMPLNKVKELAFTQKTGDFAFEKAIKQQKMSFICECKKASPSKGVIAP